MLARADVTEKVVVPMRVGAHDDDDDAVRGPNDLNHGLLVQLGRRGERHACDITCTQVLPHCLYGAQHFGDALKVVLLKVCMVALEQCESFGSGDDGFSNGCNNFVFIWLVAPRVAVQLRVEIGWERSVVVPCVTEVQDLRGGRGLVVVEIKR